jgi:hypothetical protein
MRTSAVATHIAQSTDQTEQHTETAETDCPSHAARRVLADSKEEDSLDQIPHFFVSSWCLIVQAEGHNFSDSELRNSFVWLGLTGFVSR